jgi:hypothetical protein
MSEYRPHRQNHWIPTQDRIWMDKIKQVDITMGQNMDRQNKISRYQQNQFISK